MFALQNEENIGNQTSFDLHIDEKKMKHSKYFSNCCYFTANREKRSFCCLDTIGSSSKKCNYLKPFQENDLNVILEKKEDLTLNQTNYLNNQDILISQSNNKFFNDSPEFIQIDNKILSNLQESFINQISRESIIEIENIIPANTQLQVKEEKKSKSKSKSKSKCIKPEGDSASISQSFSDKSFKGKDEANLKLDLYNLQLIEEKFSLILEGLKGPQNVSKYCKEWWTLTNNIGFINLNVFLHRKLQKI